ncbi:MAG: FkbM family methyltransferase [Candidatus Accumulibacter sp.]|nr:FkbM family methyltransferase [Accumulibacter sp.]
MNEQERAMESGGSGRAEKIGRLAACFGAGDFAGAEEIARQLVAADGQDEEALHLLAQILFKENQAPEAVELMRSVLEIDPARVSYNNDYGTMLAAIGRWDEAAAAHGMAAALDPGNFDARFNLALALSRMGEKERARVELDRALAMRPGLPEALELDGELLRAEGEPDKAVEAFRKAIAGGLETPGVYVNLGLTLKKLGRDEEAFEALRTAEGMGEVDAMTCFQLGDFHREKGNKAEAERFFRRALALRPGFAEAYNQLGVLLKDNEEMTQAAMCYAHALASDPRLTAVYVNLGGMDLREGWLESAIHILERAVEIDPRAVSGWNNLGLALFNATRLDEAEEAFRRALEILPDSTETGFNLGLLLLAHGRLAEGWPLYENRWRTPGKEKARPQFSQPEWDGGALGERTLLIYCEQGLGDNLQFARYLPLLRERHPQARLYFFCPPPLGRLFAAHAPSWCVEVFPQMIVGETTLGTLPPFDVQVALLSLPGKMGTTLENIPAGVPYIVPPPELAEKWAARLAPLPGRKVGLVWSGGDLYKKQKFRSLRLKLLEPLLGVGGINWVSLQKGKAAGQIAEEGWTDKILDLMDEAEDFADTAAIVANLDLVISVDTSVLHLAGAMGKPAWLLNRFDTDWRWLLEREDSPWYPTMRIFRQTAFGDWDSVVPRMAGALAEWVAADGGNPTWTLAVPEALAASVNEAKNAAAKTQALAGQVFGDDRLPYKIVRARHGWMLANPNDLYVGQALLEYGEYGELEARVIHRCLFKPGRIVEVGANMGGHTVGLAKLAAARGEEMVVFEPQPAVFQNLCANLALNGLRNVRAWPFACGDETGMVTFAEQNYGRPGNFGAVTMNRAAEEKEGEARVLAPCVRLDDFLGEGAVALIKIDVEGFELAVLRGADETLRLWRPVLYVENDRADQSKALIEWLWSRDYRLFWHTPWLFNPENFFGKAANHYGNTASINMICMPRELYGGGAPGMEEITDSSKHPVFRPDDEKPANHERE